MGYSELQFPAETLFLVTGGAGFIGSNLCEAILKKGCRVRCLDDLSTGKQANVDLFINHPNYEFIKGDIKDYDTCLKACEGVDNVRLALTVSGISKREAIRRSKKVLKDVGLEEHIHKRPAQLSGGQMQRVAIARALVNDPAVLLADEATGNLDTRTSFEMLVLFQELYKQGNTIIFVTHNPEIAEYASRNINLRDGKIREDTINTNIKSAAEALAKLPTQNDD